MLLFQEETVQSKTVLINLLSIDEGRRAKNCISKKEDNFLFPALCETPTRLPTRFLQFQILMQIHTFPAHGEITLCPYPLHLPSSPLLLYKLRMRHTLTNTAPTESSIKMCPKEVFLQKKNQSR